MQYDTKYGYRPTKTKDKCNIPLPASMIADLNELKKTNGDGFLFSADGGGKPVSKLTVYLKFHRALVNIGIPKEQIAERKLHLHAWLLNAAGASSILQHGIAERRAVGKTDAGYNEAPERADDGQVRPF
jgi:hypothetical protein